MTFSQFFIILRARWVAALAVLGATVGLVLTLNLLLPKKYTATAAVVADLKSPDPIAGIVLGAVASTGFLSTQVDIIQSDRVAVKVVRDLRLTQDATLRQQWQDSTGGRGDYEAWCATLVATHLDVKPSRDSNVINVSYTSPEPKFAATLANAFVRAYIDTSIELRVDPARQYNSFFETRAKDLREKVEVAQSKLSSYQKEQGILATDERVDMESQRLNELTSQLVTLQALSAESQSRSTQARNQTNQASDVINNPVVAGLRADLSRQEAKLEELDAHLGAAHPQVVELKANIAGLRSKIETESSRVSSSVGINNSIIVSRETDARAALEAQRQKLLRMKEQRDEVKVLLRDVESAQRAYDEVTQRQNKSALESQSNQTNLSILTNATEPGKSSSPRIVLNTALSFVFGTVLAIGFVVLREFMDRRVRTVQDVVDLIGVPVIGHLPKPLQGGKHASSLLLPSNMMARLPSTLR